MDEQEIRNNSIRLLNKKDFKPATWLPLLSQRSFVKGKLRPISEIASRIMALDAVFTWVAFLEKNARSERLQSYINRNSLKNWMTDEELSIISLNRKSARKQYLDNIGWKLENMWCLAWVLGFKLEPNFELGQISDEISKMIIYDFLLGLDSSINELINKYQSRPETEVILLEDLFYCCHNAVTSAQLGKKTVPYQFNPFDDGYAVYERRHALTWCLSLNIKWEDTDLNT